MLLLVGSAAMGWSGKGLCILRRLLLMSVVAWLDKMISVLVSNIWLFIWAPAICKGRVRCDREPEKLSLVAVWIWRKEAALSRMNLCESIYVDAKMWAATSICVDLRSRGHELVNGIGNNSNKFFLARFLFLVTFLFRRWVAAVSLCLLMNCLPEFWLENTNLRGNSNRRSAP